MQHLMVFYDKTQWISQHSLSSFELQQNVPQELVTGQSCHRGPVDRTLEKSVNGALATWLRN